MLWTKKDPDERTTVKEYWKATDTVSRPMAVALTLLIGFICLAVTFSLIMGGRWLYHNLSDNNKNTTQVTTETDDGITDVGESGSSTSNKSGTNGSQSVGSSTSTSTPKSTKSPTPTPTTNKSNPANNSDLPLPGSGPSELPNSGPIPE